jgi:hypothetical protein
LVCSLCGSSRRLTEHGNTLLDRRVCAAQANQRLLQLVALLTCRSILRLAELGERLFRAGDFASELRQQHFVPLDGWRHRRQSAVMGRPIALGRHNRWRASR